MEYLSVALTVTLARLPLRFPGKLRGRQGHCGGPGRRYPDHSDFGPGFIEALTLFCFVAAILIWISFLI